VDRDRPDRDGTSGLSENLTWGEISPRAIWHAAEGADAFLRELGWREFAAHLHWHHPDLATANWRRDWDRFPWRGDNPDAEAWRRGMTGEPMVDAGMRELFVTGRMHNRVRMLTASYLCKQLMTDWRIGLAWFADCLIDWDPASNALNWQWVAGSGPDAAPFFRVFSPTRQAENFDPDGTYRRRFLDPGQPEARAFFDAAPRTWGLDPAALYPSAPILPHVTGRSRALAAYADFTR
jgi:deoxyribodipyrimidine photo-lyase